MTLWSLLLVGLLAAGLGPAPAAGLLQNPPWVQGSRFTPHPKGCPVGHTHVTAEQGWINTGGPLGPGAVPAGRQSSAFCWPLGQVVPKALVPLQVTWGQQSNPSVNKLWQVTLQRDSATPMTFPPGAGCDPGVLVCGNQSSPRSSARCTQTGGTVTSTNPDGSVNCQWVDKWNLDMRNVKETGTGAISVKTQSVNLNDRQGSILRNFRLVTSVNSPLADSARSPCKDPPTYNTCKNEHPQLHSLLVSAFTQDILSTVVSIAPLYPMPVGGIWRPSFYAGRVKEDPPLPPPNGGVAVGRHIISIDPDLSRGVPGYVVRNETGYMRSGLMLNLDQMTSISAGWHQLVLQGQAKHPVNKLTQTATMGVYFEKAPRCPPNASPFMTHALGFDAVQLDAKRGTVEVSKEGMSAWGGGRWVKIFNYEHIPEQMKQPGKSVRPTYLNFTFDMSFLDPATTITSARLYWSVYFLEWAMFANETFPMEVFDADKTCGDSSCLGILPASVPCLNHVCDSPSQVGQGSFKGTPDWNRYLHVDLSPDFVTQQVARQKTMQVAVTVPYTGTTQYGGAFFRDITTRQAPPFLVLSGDCKKKRTG